LQAAEVQRQLQDARSQAFVDAVHASSAKAAPETRLKALDSSLALLRKSDEFLRQDAVADQLAAAAASRGVSAGQMYVRNSAKQALVAADEAVKPPYLDFKLDKLAPKRAPGQDFIDAKLRVVHSATAVGPLLDKAGSLATGAGLGESDIDAFHRAVVEGKSFRTTVKLISYDGTSEQDIHTLECKNSLSVSASETNPRAFELDSLMACPDTVVNTKAEISIDKLLSASEALTIIKFVSIDCHLPGGGACPRFKQPSKEEQNTHGALGLLTKDVLLLEIQAPGEKSDKSVMLALPRE
jgi:hypothetical protein